MARTCQRSATGAGPCERDVRAGKRMTDTRIPVECACAEQRFFLAQIRIVSRWTFTDRKAALRRGRGDRRQKRQIPRRRFARKRVALRDGVPFRANGKRSSASEGFSPSSECRRRPPSGIESSMAGRSSGSIASLTIRCCATRSGHRLRAAAYAVGSVGHPLRTRAFSGTSAGGVFRHHLSRRIAGGRACPSDRQGIAIGGNSALRISWPFV